DLGYLGLGNGGSALGPLTVYPTNIPQTDVGELSNYSIVLSRLSDSASQGPGIAFGSSTGNSNVGASIIFNRTSTNSVGDLQFYTKSSATSGADPGLRMTILSSGNVG